MKDLGATSYILGMEINKDRKNRKLWLGQSKYISIVVERFNMLDCKQLVVPMLQGTKLSVEDCPKSSTEKEDMAKVPYASAIGSLMCAIVCTRLDIAQAVGVLSQFMANPGRLHWDAMKRVFRYLKGTSQYALCYHGNLVGSQRTVSIQGYVDSGWAGDIDNKRSTSRYVFTLNGGAISWMRKQQVVVTLSTTETEYMTTTHAYQEVVWLKRLCYAVEFNAGHISICYDSQSAICLAKNPTFHARTKHVDV
ncbi:secreted RxLR effector protein 161-like [Cryptomeria japonica]|uniref:secreted RxLR effector protein 161-like n=1 Tax=Cryptomeria japonica TaxID=3369 RepID=UPI0027DA5741|nr:secreted RxLR effector protein 161-like [Cryptomeria japonica]